MNLVKEIIKLQKEKNAIILAHVYQRPEIQDIADFVGDSLGLSRKAQSTNASLIVFAGVYFMAETAKILNPQKKVVITDVHAGCSLADSCNEKDFEGFIKQHPNHKVISYINCNASVKALSDIICTSGNAVEIVNSFKKNEKLIFAPDKNLGAYINALTGRKMVLWDGTCKIHEMISLEKTMQIKFENDDALLIAHPECNAALLEIADFIGSTTKMIEFIKTNKAQKYIVATEPGIIHQMKKIMPLKQYLEIQNNDNCNCNECEYMKLNTLEKLYLCLKNERPEINLSDELIIKAKKPLEKMLKLSKQFQSNY